MKLNKKKVLATTLAVGGVAALAVGGTMAYFQHKPNAITNTFTVGNVEIELYESYLHRTNTNAGSNVSAIGSDGLAAYTCDSDSDSFYKSDISSNAVKIASRVEKCTPNLETSSLSTISSVVAGHAEAVKTWTGFSDEQIKDAASDYNTYLELASAKMMPGQSVRKMAYVKNTGNGDAYVRINYSMSSELADYVELHMPHTPIEQGYFVNEGENLANYISSSDGSSEIVYTFVVKEALVKDEMTLWSPITDVRLKDSVTTDDIVRLKDSGAIDADGQFTVKVSAEAIQADGFTDAESAFENFAN